MTAESLGIFLSGPRPWRLHTALETDAGGTLRRLRLRLEGPVSREREIVSDGQGQWRDLRTGALADLDGCLDVDCPATLLTRAPLLRRFDWTARTKADVRVAYLFFPSLEFRVIEQTYELFARQPRGWLFRLRSPLQSWYRTVVVDEAGLPVSIPGLAKRVL